MKNVSIIIIVALSAALMACDKGTPTPAAPVEGEAVKAVEAEPTAEKVAAPTEEAEPVIEPRGELAADLDDGATKYYGERFTVIEPPITLAKAKENAAEHAGPYKVSATIEKVCKKKGCWFTMQDESVDEPVRVTMKDYGFFVPRNADGAKAVVEGTLVSREMPQEEAQHYAEDEAGPGETPREVTGPQRVWEFTATAIELTKG